jgi:putative nucleotidyltransferase with HDIG domain
MSKRLKSYLTGLVAVWLAAITATSFLLLSDQSRVLGCLPGVGLAISDDPAVNVLAGLAFWTVLTLVASAFPVRMPGGTLVSVSSAPLVAVMVLGGPLAGGWVAAVGTTELRELRGEVPWYGTLANHAGLSLPLIAGGFAYEVLGGPSAPLFGQFLDTLVGAGIFFVLNLVLTTALVSLRTGATARSVIARDATGYVVGHFALAPLAWLMSRIYLLPQGAGWWATLLFALPLYTTRIAHHRFVEMREMFTQTIGALAEAVDKRDPFTSRHSWRVKEIAVDIGRAMGCTEAELEALEWGGLLHDIGKIGVPDNVLLKQERLNREERMIMNAHPVLGAEIIGPVSRLSAELPIIRHHHEWYNGSGYPDRLIGDEIPKLARILHVADAFEAMTAARPYRMTPLTAEQAVAELRKFAGIQFDPEVVEAFVHTRWGQGVPDPARPVEAKPIPLIGQAASQLAQSMAEARPLGGG